MFKLSSRSIGWTLCGSPQALGTQMLVASQSDPMPQLIKALMGRSRVPAALRERVWSWPIWIAAE